jgi:uncharacterized membrane protein HdeD (DUF308 family)
MKTKNKEKKEDGFFMLIAVNVLMLLYPIISFAEYFHTKDETVNKKRFIYYGLLGVVGIAGFIVAWFSPKLSQRIVIVAIAIAFYFPGFRKMKELLIGKILLGDRLFM